MADLVSYALHKYLTYDSQVFDLLIQSYYHLETVPVMETVLISFLSLFDIRHGNKGKLKLLKLLGH
jgi:hypothetical protein